VTSAAECRIAALNQGMARKVVRSLRSTTRCCVEILDVAGLAFEIYEDGPLGGLRLLPNGDDAGVAHHAAVGHFL